jgi:hypothetical protein
MTGPANAYQSIGRGGQAIAAFISYRAIASYVSSRLAFEQISIPAYRTMLLEHEPSMLSTCELVWGFVRHQSLKSKSAMIWVVMSAMFVLSFSTVTSAMTSYGSDLQPSILVDGLRRLSLDELYLVRYIIHDAERIGKTANYMVPYFNQSGLNSWSPCKRFTSVLVFR